MLFIWTVLIFTKPKKNTENINIDKYFYLIEETNK